jgi:hypothetical protein
MAVEVTGKALLDWLQYSLSNVPFYFQTQQIVLGFDGNQVPRCRINMLEVGKTLLPVVVERWSGVPSWVVQVVGNTSLSAFDLSQTYRLMSTASALTAPSAIAILGNETVSKAESTPVEGILDAVAASLASGMQPQRVTEASIVARKGLPLNPECATKATAVQSDVCTRSLSRTARKAVGGTESMTLSVRAEGSAAFEGMYVINSSLIRAGDAAVASSVEQEFTSKASPTFGLQLSWANESGTTGVDLSFNQQAVQFASGIGFRQLGCNEAGVVGSQCPADGDTVITTFRFGPRSDTRVRSESVVMTNIQAVPSCSHSVGQCSLQAGAEIIGKATVELYVFAYDLDGLPIRYTQAAVEFSWDGSVLPFKWSLGVIDRVFCVSPLLAKSACVAGSHKYYSEVPPERDAGEHEIVISLKSGWSELTPDLGRCELLRRRVTVQSDRTQLIIASVIVSGSILVLVILIWLLYKNKTSAKEFLASFASVEGVLTFKVCSEVW